MGPTSMGVTTISLPMAQERTNHSPILEGQFFYFRDFNSQVSKLLHQPWPLFYLPDFWSGSRQDVSWSLLSFNLNFNSSVLCIMPAARFSYTCGQMRQKTTTETGRRFVPANRLLRTKQIKLQGKWTPPIWNLNTMKIITHSEEVTDQTAYINIIQVFVRIVYNCDEST